MADLIIENHGSLYLVRPLTSEASAWIEEHVAEESQWWGDALVVEPRYVSALVDGMESHGLEVQ